MCEGTEKESVVYKQLGTFYQVGSFINTINDLELLLNLIMREAYVADRL